LTWRALYVWLYVKGVFTDATKDSAPPEEEALVVDLLSGLHAAFELVGLEDGALRATLALRLSLMLERRGDVRRGAVVAAEAVGPGRYRPCRHVNHFQRSLCSRFLSCIATYTWRAVSIARRASNTCHVWPSFLALDGIL